MIDYAARRRMMVDTQVRPSDVTRYPVIDAMLSVPRERFVPADRREAAYMGENLALGPGRVVLDPRTLGKMLDALAPERPDLVLDIGAGMGYSSALLSRMAGAVVAVEEDPALVREAESALASVEADNVAVIEGTLAAGAAKHGPYDAILLQGAVGTMPQTLTDQVKDGGRIVAIFMEGALGVCRIGWRRDGRITWRDAFHATAPILPGFERARTFAL